MEEIVGKYTTAKVFAEDLDSQTRSHLYDMVNNPAMNGQVRIMPDCHEGKGSVVGFTMPITDKVIPTTVGVDIGCGMLSFSVGKDLNFSVDEIDKVIRTVIPMGFNLRTESVFTKIGDDFSNLARKVGTPEAKFATSLGTLGGGNHFIELGKDDDDYFWFTIHSGSRRFGLDVCNFHQKRVDFYDNIGFNDKLYMLKQEYSGTELGKRIKKLQDSRKPLGYLTGSDMQEYLEDMEIAQRYAVANRAWMMHFILESLSLYNDSVIECVHNYIDSSDNMIRKGATRAKVGDEIILPFNRQEGIWIMEGLGNDDWNNSAPHGAGRTMSRSKAKEVLNAEDVKKSLNNSGVYSSVDPLDEAPAAYKDPEQIKRLIQPTAKFRFAIRPILNIKA